MSEICTEAPSAQARPAWKWVGGKRQLLDRLVPLMPTEFACYYEPFFGGGALFYHLKPRAACISDANLRLVRTLRAVRDDVDGVVMRLRACPNDKAFFLSTRGRPIDDERDDAEVAAWFIYLNKTAFNGLYRVNASNGFNAPFGGYRNPAICDEANLRACSRALRFATIGHGDYSLTLDDATSGDFCFLDPPYVPASATASFTSYGPGAWKPADHERLAAYCRSLDARGVRFMLTNSLAARPLYEGNGWNILTLDARRNINCDATKRGTVQEIVVRNYGTAAIVREEMIDG